MTTPQITFPRDVVEKARFWRALEIARSLCDTPIARRRLSIDGGDHRLIEIRETLATLTAAIEAAGKEQSAEPVEYVCPVPDHCDRYYHLDTITRPAQAPAATVPVMSERVRQETIGLLKDVAHDVGESDESVGIFGDREVAEALRGLAAMIAATPAHSGNVTEMVEKENK